jgi:hypothetical protein
MGQAMHRKITTDHFRDQLAAMSPELLDLPYEPPPRIGDLVADEQGNVGIVTAAQVNTIPDFVTVHFSNGQARTDTAHAFHPICPELGARAHNFARIIKGGLPRPPTPEIRE